jgi:Tfp pilus assembly protein PilN
MEIKLNLASRPYLNRQKTRLWLVVIGVILGLFLVLNLLSTYRSYQKLQLMNARFADLDRQVAGLRDEDTGYTPEKYMAVRAEVAAVNQIIDSDQFRWTALLSKFEELTPKDVSLNMIQPNYREHSLQISGLARTVSAMTRFVDRLLASEDFSQVYLQRHGEVEVEERGRKQSLTGFSIVIQEAF